MLMFVCACVGRASTLPAAGPWQDPDCKGPGSNPTCQRLALCIAHHRRLFRSRRLRRNVLPPDEQRHPMEGRGLHPRIETDATRNDRVQASEPPREPVTCHYPPLLPEAGQDHLRSGRAKWIRSRLRLVRHRWSHQERETHRDVSHRTGSSERQSGA